MKTRRARTVSRRGRGVGGRIKDMIHQRGHTYVSLAREIGITPQAVSEIVNGRTKGRTARYALAKALGLEVGDLWPEGHARAVRSAAGRRRSPRRGRAAGHR